MRAILYYGMEIVCIKPFKIVLLRAEKKQKETYSAQEIAALIQKPDLRTCSFAEFRNWAIVNYLLATGNRLETLLHIKIGDVDFVEREIRLTKLKNRRQYTIPLSSHLSSVLKECLLYRKGKADDYHKRSHFPALRSPRSNRTFFKCMQLHKAVFYHRFPDN